VGSTQSNDGDVSGYINHPYDPAKTDMWLLKIDGNGNKVWQKTLGGSERDYAESIVKEGNNFIIGGATSSSDGDISLAKGGYDIWILKINETGGLVWEKAIGGSQSEYFTELKVLLNGSFADLGSTNSNDGDVNSYYDPHSHFLNDEAV